MKRRQQKCRTCGSDFTGHYNARFCSGECYKIFKRDYERDYHKSRRSEKPERIFDPFPPEIDCLAFGHWLSGFADGESMFVLREIYNPRKQLMYQGYFRITLRDDDAGILRLIQNYWACGNITFQDNARSTVPNANPVASYNVTRNSDLMTKVIPHFLSFPLFAKKRNDFFIWKEAVEFLSSVISRPLVGRFDIGGNYPKWTDEDREKMRVFQERLRSSHRYSGRG